MEPTTDTRDEPAPLPLSVTVITKDEEERLARTLAAVAFADEIVLLDSGSQDATCAIARAAGARVIETDWPGYGPQKARAEAAARNDWILNLDADEVVTPALAAEIRALFETHAGAPPEAGYTVDILNVYPGADRPRPLAADYRVVRLYDRRRVQYRPHPLFDRVEMADLRSGRLRAPVHHFPFTSWAGLVAKENQYTSYVVSQARRRDSRLLRLRLLTEFPLVFLKTFVLRRHALGGWRGFAFSLVVAFSRTLRIIKLLERASTGDDEKSPEK